METGKQNKFDEEWKIVESAITEFSGKGKTKVDIYPAIYSETTEKLIKQGFKVNEISIVRSFGTVYSTVISWS